MAKILETKEEFNELISNNKKVLVDFYADWCPPCKMLSPIIESLSNSVKDCEIVKLNTDNNPEIKEEYNVQSIPTLILFEDGKPVKENVGFMQEGDIISFIGNK
ncbi:thioredoxin [Spiroplasma endosymbiont of Aspidapion aeneum]|uniref:thioredoxin n=1 Tax=Spiroplasma endosymbiont of Aspidapion aeneum TaxID=3066276 RepID=UPI00313D5F22